MLWNDPLILGPKINALDSVRFANLCNTLLSETAAQNAIPRACMITNLRTTEPDGGVDARCSNAPKKVGQLIPNSNVVYQFKSGNENKSATEIVVDDILKTSRVIEALLDSQTLVYIAGWERGDKFSDDVVKKASEEYELNLSGQFVFLGANNIAHLLSAFPALAADYLNIDLGGIIGIQRWSQERTFANPFQVNAELTAQIGSLKNLIEAPQSRVRIIGSAGDGKTRRVLEVLKGSSLHEKVLYAGQVHYLTPSFLNYIFQIPDVQCVIVIDEVSDAESEKLLRQFEGMPPGVGLIMIGLDASGRAPEGTYQVLGLDVDLLTTTITSIVPGLAPEQARGIAEVCEGSPKLAVLIARRIEQDPTLTSNRQLLADDTIQSVLNRYLGISETSEEWRALSLVAVLSRLGWRDIVEVESVQLFQLTGLNPTVARGHVQNLHERFGVAPLAGKYRYISPTILGDHLAARQLRSWPDDSLREFFRALTPEMRNSFAVRVGRMSHILENAQVVEEVVLGDKGLFRTLDDLESSGGASILRHLAAPFPPATLRALERLIGSATNEELLAATASRRDCVWALEVLLWPATTFRRASSLLLKLALAENETWGNNASNTWTSAFQTQLGRTAAGIPPRINALREAVSSSDPKARVLAATALGAAVNMGHAHRDGVPPKDFEGMPEEAWFPATWGEWTEAFFAYLELLKPLLSDGDVTVSVQAVKSFGFALQAALQLPRSSKIPQKPFDAWLSVARELAGASFDQREVLIDAVERQRAIWTSRIEGDEGRGLSSEAKTQWQSHLNQLAQLVDELQGQDFSSRLRTVLTRQTHVLHNEAETKRQVELQGLVSEVLAQPELLNEQWTWMLGVDQNKQWLIWQFFDTLGRVDQKRNFASTLLQLAVDFPQATMWHSMYQLAGYSSISEPEFIDEYLLNLSRNNLPVGIIFDLLMRAGYSSKRVALFTEMLERKQLAPATIASLSYHPWGDRIPTESVSTLLDAILSLNSETSPTDGASLVKFLYGYLKQKPDAKDALREISLGILSLSSDNNYSDSWVWPELAQVYVADEPLLLSIAALQQMKRADFNQKEEFRGILLEAWKVGDKQKIFEQAIAPAISFGEDGKYTANLWVVREALKGFPFEEAGVEFLMAWVKVLPERRALALAEALGEPGREFSALHAALLECCADEGVDSAFYGALSSGSWIGNMTNWLQPKIDAATEWLEDERPAVRAWAEQALKSLQLTYRSAQEQEAEEIQMRNFY